MMKVSRREAIAVAGLLGASVAWTRKAAPSPLATEASPDHFPEGVASADPTPDGVILWTRSPSADRLIAEIAEDEAFERVVATGEANPSAATDWTCRVLVSGLRPDRVYWYRFVDRQDRASRTGRTFTAPHERADRPVRFAFVSCQNINLGYSTPYRRMVAEDRGRPPAEQIRFVLHLGDFIYETVWYPEDRPEGRYAGRALRDSVRLPNGVKIGEFHVPSGVEDYRALYRAYLADPDIQDARARWPFVCVWDNHEFTNRGWQSQAVHDKPRAGQRLKVAANQAWFEYIPARVRKAGIHDAFIPPDVENAPLDRFDANGLSREPNNLAAIGSLLIARTLRWGRNVELILTDNRSFRSRPVFETEEAQPFKASLPLFSPQQVVEILDGGRAYDGGNPPATILFAGKALPNPRRAANPGSMLGSEQKAWLLRTLRESTAKWKIWGNSVGMLELRLDPANLPPEQAGAWPVTGFGTMYTHDWCGYPTERAELLEAVKKAGVTNFVSLVGDRHAFFAGLLSPTLPPKGFSPVAAEFVGGSVSTPTTVETRKDRTRPGDPIRNLYLTAGSDRPAINVALCHGVRSSLALSEGKSLDEALKLRNPDVAPHLAFADLAGHGFAIVRARSQSLEVEFVATAAPTAPTTDTVLYRVSHRVDAWSKGEKPIVRRIAAEGAELAVRYLDGSLSPLT